MLPQSFRFFCIDVRQSWVLRSRYRKLCQSCTANRLATACSGAPESAAMLQNFRFMNSSRTCLQKRSKPAFFSPTEPAHKKHS